MGGCCFCFFGASGTLWFSRAYMEILFIHCVILSAITFLLKEDAVVDRPKWQRRKPGSALNIFAGTPSPPLLTQPSSPNLGPHIPLPSARPAVIKHSKCFCSRATHDWGALSEKQFFSESGVMPNCVLLLIWRCCTLVGALEIANDGANRECSLIRMLSRGA